MALDLGLSRPYLPAYDIYTNFLGKTFSLIGGIFGLNLGSSFGSSPKSDFCSEAILENSISHIQKHMIDGSSSSSIAYWTGTQQGDFQGTPPTNKTMNIQTVDLLG
jgi:hypothetical protein